jgi:lipopolysaccharide export system permease protein
MLLMQFVWKYIDDLVGKGLEWYVIAQLMFYAAATFIPLALPLAILISSIMTFGNLAEHYELAALKSAGISLQKIMQPLVVATVCISISAFLFSNYMLPIVNLKMGSLLYDIRQSKPALDLKPGVFYKDIDNYVIRVQEKSKDGKYLYNMMIYDHTARRGASKIIIAQKGQMQLTNDKKNLLLTLYNGKTYEEIFDDKSNSVRKSFLRSVFEKQVIRFDLTSFGFERTNEELFKDNYQMLNVSQLSAEVDTFKMKGAKRDTDFKNMFTAFITSPGIKDPQHQMHALPTVDYFDKLGKVDKERILDAALNSSRNNKSQLYSAKEELMHRKDNINRHLVEWHKKFTLSFACLVLFFVGAPLGAIIRKGGIGMPMVVSVLFFLFFHVMNIMGEKFSKEGVLPPSQGMWIASAVLLPIGIFLTSKATSDSALFDINSYLKIFKIFSRKASNENTPALQ